MFGANGQRQICIAILFYFAYIHESSSLLYNNCWGHHSKVTIEIAVDGEKYILDLILNSELLAREFIISYQKNGEDIMLNPDFNDLNVCQYKGEVRGKPGSWVAISTCNGVRGVFHDGNKLHYIEPAGTTIDSKHFVYDHSKLKSNEEALPLRRINKRSNQLDINNDYNSKTFIASDLKQELPKESRGPTNSNSRSLYIELVIVVDNSLYRDKGGDLRAIYQEIKDIANVMNGLFSPLNIFIALIGIKVWSERDEIYINSNSWDTLDSFVDFRSQKLLPEMPNDHAQMLTKKKFDDGTIGKAYVKSICSRAKSASIVSHHSPVLGMMAATMVHEIGHNLGMNHDTNNCKCEGNKCIMGPSVSSVAPVFWSNCSLKDLAEGLKQNVDYCLRNKPERLLGSPTCGNGYLERGEQCDCGIGIVGTTEACKACCDPDTCRLRSNATCATGSCCDLKTCQLKPAATTCRSAVCECDLPEYCTGDSEFCPDDVHKMDTTPCGHNEAYCMHGKCRTHKSQCLSIWGSAADNGQGLCYGNRDCTESRATTASCKRDNLCGRLQCRNYGDEINFAVAKTTSKQMFLADRVVYCHSAKIDVGVDDPGMVPDGAKCGEDKMCMNAKCIDVGYLRDGILKDHTHCLKNCSQNGVCNSKGNCHCNYEFAPPFCDGPGSGGSIDSGPASDPNVLTYFMMAMYIIFLGLLPMILLILLLLWLKNVRNKKNLGHTVDIFKIQNCTAADFSLFRNISKSSSAGTKIKQNTNFTKPNLRKEDIIIVTNSDIERDVKSDKDLKVTLKDKNAYNNNTPIRHAVKKVVAKPTANSETTTDCPFLLQGKGSKSIKIIAVAQNNKNFKAKSSTGEALRHDVQKILLKEKHSFATEEPKSVAEV